MDEKGEITYSFELKDLSYKELCDVYKSMSSFITFLRKSKDDAEVVSDNEEKEEEES